MGWFGTDFRYSKSNDSDGYYLSFDYRAFMVCNLDYPVNKEWICKD